GFRNLRCLVRPSSNVAGLDAACRRHPGARIDIIKGNLLSRRDCDAAADGVALVFHLAAGRGEKSFPDAFINSVVTTRNLLDACVGRASLRRFVSISSFAVYDCTRNGWRHKVDETCP